MGAKALALTHFVPPEFGRAALLAEVAETFAGPVFVGEDLMGLDLASGDVTLGEFRARLCDQGRRRSAAANAIRRQPETRGEEERDRRCRHQGNAGQIRRHDRRDPSAPAV